MCYSLWFVMSYSSMTNYHKTLTLNAIRLSFRDESEILKLWFRRSSRRVIALQQIAKGKVKGTNPYFYKFLGSSLESTIFIFLKLYSTLLLWGFEGGHSNKLEKMSGWGVHIYECRYCQFSNDLCISSIEADDRVKFTDNSLRGQRLSLWTLSIFLKIDLNLDHSNHFLLRHCL